MHTHQTWAVALNILDDNRLLPATQTAALLQNIIAYDHDYSGLATELAEGERLAAALGDKSILFMKNHGVMVAANSIAVAYRLLYLLERACRTQILAMSTGAPLSSVTAEVVEGLQTPDEHDRHRGKRHTLYFDAMKRVLDRDMPGYAE
jgi:ribulose-5-phosphate 4-epimerase/fuculose-1-phosphate aldolase